MHMLLAATLLATAAIVPIAPALADGHADHAQQSESPAVQAYTDLREEIWQATLDSSPQLATSAGVVMASWAT